MRWSSGCSGKPAVPLCTDQDWDRACPSGCRLQGLMSRRENVVDAKLWTACEAMKTSSDAAETAMRAMTQIYNKNRRVIVSRYMSELEFVGEAESLTGNLTLLRKRSAGLRRRFQELSVSARRQIDELHRTEVDIAMTLRSCGGSCRSAPPFAVDHLGRLTLRSDLKRLEERRDAPPASVPRVELRQPPAAPPPGDYKSIPTVQRELLTQFEDVGQNRMVLEDAETDEG